MAAATTQLERVAAFFERGKKGYALTK